jgi:hypothetical protein
MYLALASYVMTFTLGRILPCLVEGSFLSTEKRANILNEKRAQSRLRKKGGKYLSIFLHSVKVKKGERNSKVWLITLGSIKSLDIRGATWL